MGLSKQLYEEIERFEEMSLNGEINEVDAFWELKQLEELIELKSKNISKGAMRLVRLEKDAKLEKNGYIFQVQQKTTWEFDHITKWVETKNQLTSIQDQAKLAYQLSQKINLVSDFENPGSQIANVNSGEVIDVAYPKLSEPFLKVDKIKSKK